jgi:putative ABC transport system permease protein
MVTQLLVVGYVLIFLFDSDQPLLVLTILAVMIVVASWIALRPLRFKIKSLYLIAIGAISIGSLPVLVISTQLVIQVEPWFEPRYLIPLAGMIFSNAMNSVSIAAERFQAELDRDSTPIQARNIAMNAAMIPLVNSLFAVGIVSLPGMMTGQVLSGISP